MQSSRTFDCLSHLRRLRIAPTRCLAVTTQSCNANKEQLVPGNVNSYFRIFGFKTEKTSIRSGNILYSHRRRLRRAISTIILTPFYIGDFFLEKKFFFHFYIF